MQRRFSLPFALVSGFGLWSLLGCGGAFEDLVDQEVGVDQPSAAPETPEPSTDSELLAGIIPNGAERLDERLADLPKPLMATVGKRPITIIQYSDWRCPHCTRAVKQVADRAEIKGLSLEWRNFPLSAGCNPLLPPSGRTDDRCELALASLCRPTGFWDLVETAEARSQPFVDDYREDSEFVACMDSPETKEALEASVLSAKDLNIQGTPTFFLNIGDQTYSTEMPELLEWLK